MGPLNQRILDFDSVVNVRDVGGYPTHDGATVRWGRVLRSGHLGAATDADVARLDSLGVEVAIDLRADREVERDGPNRLPPGSTNARFPMGNPDGSVDIVGMFARNDPEELERHLGGGRAEADMTLRTAAAATERAAGFRGALGQLARQPERTTIVNCTAGKDRTGIAIAFLLRILGVDRETVLADYLLSNETHREGLEARLAAAPPQLRDVVSAYGEVRPVYLDATFAAIDETHGSWDTYVTNALALDTGAITRLRDALLE